VPYGQPTFDTYTMNGDYDGDGDIDGTDYVQGFFAGNKCEAGSGSAVSGACRVYDYDDDKDVDDTDQTRFVELYGSSGMVSRQPARRTSANALPFANQGLLLDEETQTYQNRHRQYDPWMKRFVQRDALQYVDSLCLYEYQNSSMANRQDPSGAAVSSIGSGIVDIIVGIGDLVTGLIFGPVVGPQVDPSCDGLNMPTEDMWIDACNAILDVDTEGISPPAKWCLRGRCRSGNMRATVNCDCPQQCQGALGCWQPNTPNTTFLCTDCGPSGGCNNISTIFHELAHSCGVDSGGPPGHPHADQFGCDIVTAMPTCPTCTDVDECVASKNTCFTANTVAWTARGLIAMEDIRPDDTFYVVNDTQADGCAGFGTGTLQTHCDQVTILTISLGDATIECTPDHAFLTCDCKWLAAGAIRRGDCLATLNGAISVSNVTLRSAERLPVYNVDVSGHDRYVVGVSGLIVRDR